MTAPLASLQVRGFRSIADLTLPLSSPVTLLVGANGSGKSNLIAAFELLGRIVDHSFQEELLRSGGLAAQLHRSPTGEDATSLEITMWGEPGTDWRGERIRNGYSVTVTAGHEDSALLAERTFTHKADLYPTPYENRLGTSRESRLKEAAEEHQANRYVLDVLAGCRVFHFDDASPDAPPLRRSSTADSLTLRDDGSNIAALLYSVQGQEPARYQRIVRSIRTVAPFFDDFVLEPVGETVQLRWREKGLDGVFPGSALSSGTLRFVCLAVLLQQPDPPATIVLDEPELGLHPFAIHQLADLLRSAAADRRIVAATQSVTLLGQFAVEEIAVVDRVDGTTRVSRPDVDALATWLDDYSLGELWEMNVLGGRPQPPGVRVQDS